MLDKFGGDTIDDTRDALERYVGRISRTIDAPVAGGRHGSASPAAVAAGHPTESGGDEAGSGGDD
jgi:hypothetical protein